MMHKLTLFRLLLLAEILNSLVLLQIKLVCAFKPGFLMNHNWLHTPHSIRHQIERGRYSMCHLSISLFAKATLIEELESSNMQRQD